MKFPVYFSALVTLVLVVLTTWVWPETRGIVQLSLASACVTFAGATVLFLGHDKHRKDLIHYGQWLFTLALVVFLVSMYLVSFFGF